MKVELVDVLSIVLCNVLVLAFLVYRVRDHRYKQIEKSILVLLWLVHLIFSVVFADYILLAGGDSLGYWELTADTSQYAESWFGYFGINTFFIQWLNYIPYKVFGLNYLSGTILYASLSYAGFVLVFDSLRSLIAAHQESLSYSQLLYLPLFLPGLHFWTAGVTKESLLFLGLGLMFYSFTKKKYQLILALLGWALCLMVRPFIGFVFLPFLGYHLVLYLREKSLMLRVTVLLAMGLLMYRAGQQFLVYLHVGELSWERLKSMSASQFRFLNAYEAQTAIAMGDLSLVERWVAVSFRPFIWESWDLYSLVFALENTCLFAFVVIGIGIGWKKTIQIPASIKYYTIISFGMFLVFTFTLNNLGLFYRMKSIWLPFLHIAFLWLICASLPRSKSPTLA